MNIKNEVVKLLASDGDAHFGQTVSISSDGDTVIVGDCFDGATGNTYLYDRIGTGWSKQTKLMDGRVQYHGSSTSISADGNILVVGAHGENNYVGGVYIYNREIIGWVQKAKLLPNDSLQHGCFGMSVAISGDGNTVVVGCSNGVYDAGSVYIYSRNGDTWVEKAKLMSDDKGDKIDDKFGNSVGISHDGNVVIVGASGANDGEGSVFIYVRTDNTWTKQTRLTATDTDKIHLFGSSIVISGDGNTAVIGANIDGPDCIDAGIVFVFNRDGDTWTTSSNLSNGYHIDNYFGWSLGINSDGTKIIIGDIGGINHETGEVTGSAYICSRTGDTWSCDTKLLASDGVHLDEFGTSVAISGDGNTAIVGARLDDNENGDSAGSVYIFDLT